MNRGYLYDMFLYDTGDMIHYCLHKWDEKVDETVSLTNRKRNMLFAILIYSKFYLCLGLSKLGVNQDYSM